MEGWEEKNQIIENHLLKMYDPTQQQQAVLPIKYIDCEIQ